MPNKARERALRLALGFAVLGLALLTVAFFVVYRWEWGLMDDVGFVLSDRAFLVRYGLIKGVFLHVAAIAHDDALWGLFRPAYWLYAATIYLLPPNSAHFLRLILVGGIFATATTIVRRAQLGRAASASSRALGNDLTQELKTCGALFLVIGAIHPLYDGLSFVSLQEHSGLALVLVAYALAAPRGDARRRSPKREAAAAACLLAAALFKTPFVWSLAAFAVLLWRAKRVPGAALCALAVIVDLVVSATWAKSGGYTSRSLGFEPMRALTTLAVFAKQLAAPAAVAALLQFALRLRARITKRRFDCDECALALIASGALYLANLLPWGSPSYHMSPPIVLILTGLLTLVAPRLEASRAPRRASRGELAQTAALALAVVLSASVASHGIWKAFARNGTIVGIRDWILRETQTDVQIGINGGEAAATLADLVRMRGHGAWRGFVTHVADSPSEPIPNGLEYYIVLQDQGPGRPDLTVSPVAHFPLGAIYEIRR